MHRVVRVRLPAYDWLLVNTSGGKDSMTMLRQVVLRCQMEGVPLERVVAVHARLRRVEWDGVEELAREQAAHYGVRFEVVEREKEGLLQAVLSRRAYLDARGRYDTSPWPSPTERWCTSYYKRDQVKKLFTRLVEETRAHKGKSHRTRILNCLGMRAGESSCRSKMLPFRLNPETNGRKVVHDYLPLHAWGLGDVWDDIHASGVRYHDAYAKGMPRLSCVMCIFAPREALLLAGKHNPSLLREYVEVEKKVRSKFRVNLALADVLADVEAGVEPGPVSSWEM